MNDLFARHPPGQIVVPANVNLGIIVMLDGQSVEEAGSPERRSVIRKELLAEPRRARGRASLETCCCYRG